MAAQEPSPPSSLEGNKPGFPKKILANNLEDKHFCNACQKVLRRPLQAQCGHRFCYFCFNKIVSSGPQKCSACIKEDLFEEPTSILKQGGAFPDNAARREVEALAAVCPNEGCTWMGTIKEFEVMDVLKALYKQYHYSPKARRELRELADVLHQKIWKPTNVGGTRWLPHLQRALGTLLKNYPVLLAQLENTIETRVKRELRSSVVASLQHRFQGVESHQVLLAASRLVDPWEWPADQQELASYGSDHVNTVVEHFADVLDRMGCDREKAKRIEWPSAEVIIKSLPQGLQQNAWQDFFVDDDRRKKLF